MKLILTLCFFMWIAAACNYKKPAPEDLTSISVVRDVADPNEARNESAEKNNILEEKTITPIENTRPQYKKQGPQYHIIVASFTHSERDKADKLVKRLKAMDYNAGIIDMKGRLRVSLASYADKQTAETERDKYREITDRQDIWIFKSDN